MTFDVCMNSYHRMYWLPLAMYTPDSEKHLGPSRVSTNLTHDEVRERVLTHSFKHMFNRGFVFIVGTWTVHSQNMLIVMEYIHSSKMNFVVSGRAPCMYQGGPGFDPQSDNF